MPTHPSITNPLYDAIRLIIHDTQKGAYIAVNHAMVRVYWNIGQLIVKDEQTIRRLVMEIHKGIRHCTYCAKIVRIPSHTRSERMNQNQYTGFKKIIATLANSKRSKIHTINFADPLDKARHDRIVALVTQMLDLNKKLQDVRLEQDKTQLSRQIEATDGAIDTLVYALYGLTEEEIKIVEGAHKG